MDLEERLNANELGVRISTRKGRGTHLCLRSERR